MYGRYLMIASASLLVAGSASAEPSKPAAQPQAQPAQSQPAKVVFASADQVETPVGVAEAQAAAPAKKPRAARVTTCRCGAQTPQNDQ